ncbi:MAG: hypothetical protein LAO79_28495, partial [Acidobacteriia bacterium]|nr:hypothetical protein [Terriglobia bacterium]
MKLAIYFLSVFVSTSMFESIGRAGTLSGETRCSTPFPERATRKSVADSVFDRVRSPHPREAADCISGTLRVENGLTPNDRSRAGFYQSGSTLIYLSQDPKNPLSFNLAYTSSSGTFSGTAQCAVMPGSTALPLTCVGSKTVGTSGNETDQTAATIGFDESGKITKIGLILQKVTTTGGGCACTTLACQLAILAGEPCPDPIPGTSTTVSSTLLDINSPLKLVQSSAPSVGTNDAVTFETFLNRFG